MKIAVILFVFVVMVIFFGVTFWLEIKYPMHELVGTTPEPPEHMYVSLPPHKEKQRQMYSGNAFLQMLHQVHQTTNATQCWICGLLPSMTHENEHFVSLPLSYIGSCEAWFQLLTVVYTHSHADAAKLTESDYEAVLEHIVMHQGYTLGKGGKQGTLHPDACMNVYERSANTSWEKSEMLDFQGFNNTEYFKSFHRKNIIDEEIMPIPIIDTPAPFCVEGFGDVPVGRSQCNYTFTLNTISSPPFLTPPNVYFVCGAHAYVWLPRGWAGSCYVSLLLPPVYLAPSNYHQDYKLQQKGISLSRVKRVVNTEDVDQTDTTMQKFADAMEGLLPLWGPMYNSRKIRQFTGIVEAVINTTAGILTNITAELQATRLVALQNRMALDVILADRGGACRIIGSSCCVYIPDHAPTVYSAIQNSIG